MRNHSLRQFVGQTYCGTAMGVKRFVEAHHPLVREQCRPLQGCTCARVINRHPHTSLTTTFELSHLTPPVCVKYAVGMG